MPYELVGGAAKAGVDFTATSGSVSFLPGQRVAEVPVVVKGDVTREMLETFHLALDPPAEVASVTGGTAVIESDDSGSTLPTLRIEGSRLAEGDSSSVLVRFLLTLSETTDESVRIPYRLIPGTAVFGDDYANYSSGVGRATISAGQSQVELNVRVYGDTLAESDELVVLEVLSPVGAQLPGGAASISTRPLSSTTTVHPAPTRGVSSPATCGSPKAPAAPRRRSSTCTFRNPPRTKSLSRIS